MTTPCLNEYRNGTIIDIHDPQPEDIHIEDIAHALSNICRFKGHTRYFLSVAAHSLVVSYMVPKEFALQGLLHDAAEAYIGDISTPIKYSVCKDIIPVENRFMEVIGKKFGFDHNLDQSVKEVDRRMCSTEHRLLMPNGRIDHVEAWGDYAERYPSYTNKELGRHNQNLLTGGLVGYDVFDTFVNRFYHLTD